MSAPLPIRPRVAGHALVRRHFVDGREMVVVHDTRSGDLVRMDPRAWDLVSGADGTRDFDALVLDAARRGVFQRISEVRAVLEGLHAAGLLSDGLGHATPADPVDPSRPLEVLPRFSLTCDGSGGCCSMYGSVLFTPLEAARARALRPLTLGGGDDEARAFTPERGSVRVAKDERLAVALVDGACGYLKEDGRCWLHLLGGEDQKPRGCSIYPATFVDDGESVRVSVGVECSCVAASAGKSGGAPLVDAEARTRGDLGPSARVAALPETIAVTRGGSAKRADFVAWSKAVAGLLPDEDSPGDHDVVALLWSLARAIDAGGLDESETREAVLGAKAPDAADLAPWIEALNDRCEARVKAADAWRGQRDRSRLASHWMAAAAAALRGPALDSALGASGRFGRDERFWLRAMLHGHQLAGDLPLSAALRDRAVRALLSRVLPDALPEGEAARAHPIALVEAMMRGHGLGAYAAAVRA